MKMSKMIWTAAAIMITAHVSMALADDADQPATRADKFEARLQSRFAKADINGDGKLTPEEAKSGMPRVYAHFDEIDTDKKGFVTIDQIEAFAMAKEKARKQQNAASN